MTALPRILNPSELAHFASTLDFAQTNVPRVQTADIRPIDTALGMAITNWMSASSRADIPSVELDIVVHHPPTPEAHQRYVKPERWAGWDQPIHVKTQGCAVGDDVFLFVWLGTQPTYPKLWGVLDGSTSLTHGRSLPIAPVEALGSETNMGAMLADLERRAIDPVTGPGHYGSGPALRI